MSENMSVEEELDLEDFYDKRTALEERYIQAYEAFMEEQKGKVSIPKADKKDAEVGRYLYCYGDQAMAEFKNDVSVQNKKGEKEFNYNKLTAFQKDVYSGINYVQNTKDRDKRLMEGVEKLMNGEEYQKFLQFRAKFHNYSFNNQILIYMQKPDASFVAGIGKWKQEFGAGFINKGEKGIMISRPNIKEFNDKEKLEEYLNDPKHSNYFTSNEKQNLLQKLERDGKASVITSFSYTNIWDVSQLSDKEGKPLKLDIPEIRKQIGKDFENYEAVRDALVAVSDVPITYIKDSDPEATQLSNAYGFYTPSTDTITVQDVGFTGRNGEKRSESDCIRTTIHEMAHSMLHGKEMRVEGVKNSSELSRSVKEIEAESVAFMVCDHLGIDSSCNSFGYLASYLPSDPQERYKALDASMRKINKCAQTIIEKLDLELEKKKTNEKTDQSYNKDTVVELMEDMEYLIRENMEGLDRDECMDLYESGEDVLKSLNSDMLNIRDGYVLEADDVADTLKNAREALEELSENAEYSFLQSLDVDIDEVYSRTDDMLRELVPEQDLER